MTMIRFSHTSCLPAESLDERLMQCTTSRKTIKVDPHILRFFACFLTFFFLTDSPKLSLLLVDHSTILIPSIQSKIKLRNINIFMTFLQYFLH